MEHLPSSPTTVLCEGEVGSEHPRIYLNIDPLKGTVCPYCSRHFGGLEGGTITVDQTP